MPKSIKIIESKDLKTRSKSKVKMIDIDIQHLSKQVSEFQSNISKMLDDIKDGSSSFRIEEVTINAEITVGGEIGIPGFNFSGTGKSAISFKFSRKN